MTQTVAIPGSNGTANHIKKPAPTLIFEDFTRDPPPVIPIEETYQDKFQRSIMDQAKDYPLPEPVINIIQNGDPIPFLTKKSFSLWQGKQKSKKTTLLALAIAAYIRPNPLTDGIRFEGAMPGKVLFFDNEQGESYAARTMKLILKLAGIETSPNLVYCDLREFSPADRVKIIQAGVECNPDTTFLVIDGIVDLLTDFMDAGEGHLSISNIIRLCSIHDIHVAGVLHQNKNDKNARAHVGTISSQKCEIEISTEVDPDNRTQSLVTCVNSRGLPFEPFAIKWEKGSLPCICQDWTVTVAADEKASKKKTQIEEVAKSIFKPLAAIRPMEAIEKVMEATMKSEATAKRHLRDLCQWKILTHTKISDGGDGLYRLNMDKGSGVHEGSNGGS